MANEFADAGAISLQTLDEFDGLLIQCHEFGLLDDASFRLAMEDQKSFHETFGLPAFPWYGGLHNSLIEKSWDRLKLGCNIRASVDFDHSKALKKPQLLNLEVAVVLANKIAQKLTEAEPRFIAMELRGLGGETFLYLHDKPNWITFEELQEVGLTKSENPESIRTMLYGYSRDLKEYGYRIKIKLTKKLTKLEQLP